MLASHVADLPATDAIGGRTTSAIQWSDCPSGGAREAWPEKRLANSNLPI